MSSREAFEKLFTLPRGVSFIAGEYHATSFEFTFTALSHNAAWQAWQARQPEIDALKQERDELAAQVEERGTALLLYKNAGFGNSTDFRLQAEAYNASFLALSLTPSAALREIQARVLEEAAESLRNCDGYKPEYAREFAGFIDNLVAAKRKGE